MAWQGVPFLHQSLGFMDSGVLTLNRIPLITVDTGFGWDAILASLIAAIVGGAIPAYISWRAIKNNNDALMHDRETQSRLSEKQLTAQLVVSSRMQWINECRENAARYIGSVQLLLNIQNRIYFDLSDNKEKDYEEIVGTSASRMHDTLTDATFYKAKIELLLNPNEKTAVSIVKIMNDIMAKVNKYSYSAPVNYDEVGEKFNELKEAFAIVLKDEWERVKRFD